MRASLYHRWVYRGNLMAYKVIYARGGFIGIYEQQPGLQHKPLYKRIIVHIYSFYLGKTVLKNTSKSSASARGNSYLHILGRSILPVNFNSSAEFVFVFFNTVFPI